MHCDSFAVIQVVATGKTRDPFLAACSQNIWLFTATLNIDLRMSHIKGSINNTADLLSHLYSNRGVDLTLLGHLRNNCL